MPAQTKLWETVNVYKKPVIERDPQKLKMGFLSTLVYVVLLAAGFIVIAVYLFQQTRVFEFTVKEMTFDKLLDIEDRNPTCKCTHEGRIRMQNLTSLNDAALASINAKYNLPGGTTICSLISEIFDRTNAKRTVADLVLEPLSRRCIAVSDAATGAQRALSFTPVPDTNLAARGELRQEALAAYSTYSASAAGAFYLTESISNILAYPSTQSTPSVDPSTQFNATTTNSGARLLVDAADSGCCKSGECASFDIELAGVTTSYSCQVATAVAEIDLRVFGAQFVTDFVDAGEQAEIDVSGYATYASDTTATSYTEFLVNAGSFWNEFTPTLEMSDDLYEGYFDLCRPSQCTYTERREPDISESITLALGLLGGLTTALKSIVGFVGASIYGKCCGGSAEKGGVRIHVQPSDEKAGQEEV